jgi:hypothetical protein
MIPDFDTIENTTNDLITSGLVLALIVTHLIFYWQWAVITIQNELAHSGAWQPWTALGVAFLILMIVEVIFYIQKLLRMKIRDPLRK